MVAVIVARDKRIWIRVERFSIFTFAAFSVALVYLSLWRLLSAIIYRTELILPTTLLASAVALWLVNIAVSGLVYWQMDRGGPEGRAARTGYPDFSFPQDDAEGKVPPGWLPSFMDYLALARPDMSRVFARADVLPIHRSAISR